MKFAFLILGMISISANDVHAFGRSRSNPSPRPQPISAPAATPVPASTPQPTPTATPVAIPVATPVPTATPVSDNGSTGGLEIVVHQANNYNQSQKATFDLAISALQKVVNTEEFKQKVLHFTYQGQETYVQNEGLSNLQIYNRIMQAAEMYPKATSANKTMDLWTALYTSIRSERDVIGYTYVDTSFVYSNTYFFNNAEISGIAGNIIHEWLHKVGFDHDYEVTSRRPASVPYAIGYIVEGMIQN